MLRGDQQSAATARPTAQTTRRIRPRTEQSLAGNGLAAANQGHPTTHLLKDRKTGSRHEPRAKPSPQLHDEGRQPAKRLNL